MNIKGDIIALFEETKKDKTHYLVLLDKSGEIVLSYLNVTKATTVEKLSKKLTDAGLNVEIRESAEEVLDFEL